MPSPERPTPSVFAGLFVVTLCTLMHEILLTRIFSVTMWYHFAFMAISVAMFGMTVGAIIVYLRPHKFTPDRASEELTRNALFYAVSLVVGFLVYLQIPFIGDASLKGLACLAASYTVIAVPFVFSGITVAIALTKFPADVTRLYAADLLGAAVGCVALIYTLEVAGGATSVLVVAALIAVGATLFSLGARDLGLRRLSGGAAAVLALVAGAHLVLTERGEPVIEIVDTGSHKTTDYHYVKWNSHSRVSVVGNPFEPSPVVGWGLSDKTGATEARVPQLAMAVDTWAATVITQFGGDLGRLSYLKDDVTNLAHQIRHHADVFVVGVGGGRDILSALVFNQKSVTGVEINQNVLNATTNVFGDFAGHIEKNPKVHLYVDEARSFITRSDRRFDIIQLSLIDTWAATAAGAFVLSENSLYTADAWETFLRRLKPHGILTVSRWYYPARPGEALRVASLARAALERIGVDEPRDHVIMVKAPHASGLAGQLGNGIATILVSPDPFSADDLRTLREQIDRLGFEFIVTPDRAESSEYATILSGRDLGAFYASYPLDITAPTDEKPFFFQMLRVEDFADSLDANMLDPNRANLQAIRVLAALLLIVTVLTALCVIVPLALTTRKGDLEGSTPHLLYFFAIGLGFMFVEISQMQRLMVFLGHPTYALSVVLFTLLVGSGLGSLLSGRLFGEGRRISTVLVLGVLLGVLVVFGLVTPWVTDAFAASTTPVRVVAASAILFVIGLFMGMPFPIGMRTASERAAARLTPWLWGINGAASVLCSVLATVVAMSWGIPTAFWVGVVCYAGALAAHGWLGRARAVAG